MGILAKHVRAALLLALLAMAAPTRAVNCAEWPSCDPRPRRILFMVDGSLSIGAEEFQTNMTDFVINTYCGFSNTQGGTVKYEAGVIVFNRYIETYIPFQEFTPQTFEAEVNAKVRYNVNISCCTTHAEAAILAKEMFDDPNLDDGFEDIAFIITDGLPAMNSVEVGHPRSVLNDARAEAFYDHFGLDMAEYTSNGVGEDPDEEQVHYVTQLLPQAVRNLIDSDIRLFFIGVPRSRGSGELLNVDLFNGKQKTYCSGDVCADMLYRPLVSRRPQDHTYAVEKWDIQPLVTEALEKICKVWVPPSEGRQLCDSYQPGPYFDVYRSCDVHELDTFAGCCSVDGLDMLGVGSIEPNCREMRTGGGWWPEKRSFSGSHRLDLNIEMYTDPAEDVPEMCCELCQVWGDPQLRSFDGTPNEWIMCDARTTSCTFDEATCLSMTDHTGQPCLWDPVKAALVAETPADIDVHGSPCAPDFSASRPTMKVYETNGFAMTVAMDERGMLFSATITDDGDERTLTADDCMSQSLGSDPGAAWTGPDVPETYFVKDSMEGDDTIQVVWQAGSITTGIIAEIVCIRAKSVRDGRLGNSRLNIRNVVEQRSSDRTFQDGACPSGTIPESAASGATPHSKEVWSACVGNIESHMCKVLGQGSCTPIEMLSYADEWCAHIYPQWRDAEECSRLMRRRGNTDGQWKNYYCKNLKHRLGMNMRSCHRRMNRELEDFVELMGAAEPEPRCGASTSDYAKRTDLQRCTRGFSVEYLRDGETEWREALFIPEDFRPCDGTLQFAARQYPDLFRYPVRIRQCEPPQDCSMESRCRSNKGWRASIRYRGC